MNRWDVYLLGNSTTISYFSIVNSFFIVLLLTAAVASHGEDSPKEMDLAEGGLGLGAQQGHGVRRVARARYWLRRLRPGTRQVRAQGSFPSLSPSSVHRGRSKDKSLPSRGQGQGQAWLP